MMISGCEKGEMQAGGSPRLFFRRWRVDAPAAQVLVVHGLGENTGRYVHVGQFLQRAGFDVLAVDLRGHGRSGGRRGAFLRYEDLASDLEFILATLEVKRTIVFAHSFGAQLSFWTLARSDQRPLGLIASAPWIGLTEPASPWLRGFARVMHRCWRWFPFPTGITGDKVSSDEAFIESLEDKYLLIPFIRLHTYFEAERAAADLLRRPFCPVPVLIAHGTADRVTSPAVTQQFFHRLEAPAKTLKLYPDLRHELHNEAAREKVLQDYLAWMQELAGLEC
ncbi:MAG: alpha/beta fold hydrolase [Verrucomicrobia bacterium]|nr:alpha/beta fold hydrolase [Verrucomicrobiota bacterium]